MSSHLARIMLFVAALCWGAGNVAQKTVLDTLGPFTVTGIRGLLAVLVVLPLAWLEQRQGRPLRPTDVGPAIRIALLFAVATSLEQIGYGGTSVTNGGFLMNASIVLTPLLAWMLYAEPPRWLVWPASILAAFGIWLMGGGTLTGLAWGDSVCLASGMVFAFWTVQVGHFVQRTGRPATLALVQFLALEIMGFSIGVAYEPVSLESIAAQGCALLILGVVTTGIAFVLAAIGQQRTPPGEAAIIMSGEAVFGATAAALLLNESPGFLTIGGGLLIVCAILIVQIDVPDARAAAWVRWLNRIWRSIYPGYADYARHVRAPIAAFTPSSRNVAQR